MFVRRKVFSTLRDGTPICFEAVPTYLHYRACKNEVDSLSFDIKHFSLKQPSATAQQRDYQYYTKRSYDNQKEMAELFILKFANLDKYLVLLPQSVWLSLSRSQQTRTDGAGVVGLASDTLPSLSPFVVYEQDLCDAVDSWMDAATLGRTYRNPTTGVELIGYNPKLTNPPPIIPASSQPNSMASYGAIRFLRQKILDSGVKGFELCFNPLAPLFADFHLRVPSTTSEEVHLLLVEHKLGQTVPTTDGVSFRLHHSSPKRSPMHPLRQWHWLIWQLEETVPGWFCFGCHDIKPDWRTKSWLSLTRAEVERYRYQDIVRMIEHIGNEASKAILAVQHILAEGSDAADLEVLLTSNATTNVTVDAQTGPATGPKSHAEWHSGLHWLYDRFNKQCKNGGSLVLLPLDGRHPYGNYVIAEHTWTPEQGSDFDQTRALPIQAFDAYIGRGQSKRPRRCVVMRFWDMSRSGHFYGAFLTIRVSHRYHPSTDQSYMIVGSILDSDVLANMEQQPQYLLLPSEFQKQLGKPGDKSEHEGDQYYRSRPMTENEQGHAVRKGSEDMTNNIDPLHFLVDFDSIYSHILDLMSENGESEIRIKNSQTDTADLTPPILREKYLTTLPKVHQAAWDFGCT